MESGVTAVVYLGSLVVAYALIMRSQSHAARPSVQSRITQPGTAVSLLQFDVPPGVPATLPDGLTSLQSTVQGSATYGTYTIAFFVTNGTLTDEVTLTLPSINFDTAADLATYLTGLFAAYDGPLSLTPAWDAVAVTQSNSILTFSFGTLTAEFAYTTSTDTALLLLGFPLIVPSASPISFQSSFTGSQATTLSIYTFSARVTLGPGDLIVGLTSRSMTFQVTGTGTWIVTSGTHRVKGASFFEADGSFRIQAFTTCRLTLMWVTNPGLSFGSPEPMMYETYEYASPGIFVIPEGTQSVYIEAIGAGHTSLGFTTHGGAGGLVAGYLDNVTAGRTLTIQPGQTAGQHTSVLDDSSPAVYLAVAGGGGQGGTDVTMFGQQAPTGGSAFGFHGQQGFPAMTVASNTNIVLPSTIGTGGTGVSGGLGAVPQGNGSAFQGGTFADLASGGSGFQGGGTGGKYQLPTMLHYGGAGGGSSFTNGLSLVQTTFTANRRTTPTTTKLKFPGTYGNGGNKRTPFGRGFVGIQLFVRECSTQPLAVLSAITLSSITVSGATVSWTATGYSGYSDIVLIDVYVSSPLTLVASFEGSFASSGTFRAFPTVSGTTYIAGLRVRRVCSNQTSVVAFSNTQLYTAWTFVARGPVANFNATASSSDGSKLVASTVGGSKLLYLSSDSGVTWSPASISPTVGSDWSSVASSADGTKLVASCQPAGTLFTSTNSGSSWSVRDSPRVWSSVASSSDGSRLVATVNNGQIYTSTDSGVFWTPQETTRNWISVASSADGSRLIAAVFTGFIYTSTNSGVTWVARESVRNWVSVASSSDGLRLIAGEVSGGVYVSSDGGTSWTLRLSLSDVSSVTSSSNGLRLAVVGQNQQIHVSNDGGSTFIAFDSSRIWFAIASSASGSSLVGAVFGGRLFTGSLT